MSLKVLCFGENQFLKRVVGKLRTDRRESTEEQIIVDNLQVKGKSFLTFSISNPQLIGSQATGTSGLLYFLDPALPMYEQKQFFFGIIGQRKQFQGIPAVIVYDKDQNLNIKQIVNYFQLFKVKDRATMIKQVDLQDKQTIVEIFGWIDNQIQFRKTRTFDAPPKIVKMKPKYRQSEPQSTQKKYETIVKQKKFKNVGVKAQEQAYIAMQKQRIKNQNMEKQLAHFNKNKKKMAPYDIKATPNPKIDANLHFFLKDARVDKTQEVNIKIQTDQFKQKPKQKPYVPKKTGVNTATQIQSTQLFDFAKEVQPILDILTTRALQEAALAIEQEQQILKIMKYKSSYNDKVKTQKKHEQQNIQQQLMAIKQKQRILQFARKKDQSKKQVAKKQLYYSVANTFLQNIYKDAAFSLYKKNFYPNEFEHALKTNYIPQILIRSLSSYEKILQNQKCLQNVFQQNCLKPIQKEGVIIRNQNKLKKSEKQLRRANKNAWKRYIHIYYDSNEQKKFASFSKYLNKQLDGNLEQYIKSRQQQIQQFQDKFQAGQIEQSQVQRIKQKDNTSFSQTHNCVLINNQKSICFETAQNKYSPPQFDHNVVPGCLIFDKQGNLVQNYINSSKSLPYAKQVNDLRYKRDLINFDKGIVIDLDKIQENVRSLVFYLKIANVGTYLTQAQLKNIKNSAYQLQFYQKAIPIFKQDIGTKIKWEQLVKPAQGGDGGEAKKVQQTLYVWAYHVLRKGKQSWEVQQLNMPSKIIEQSNSNQFIQKITNFYGRSMEIFKVQDQQLKPTPKISSRNSKRKSRKNIAQQKQVPPPKIQTKLTSRILKQVQVDLAQNWQKVFNKLGDSIIDWKQFIQNSPDGWHLEFRGKKLEKVEQLQKYNKVGDIILKKVIPAVEEEQKPEAAEEGADGYQKQQEQG